MACVALLTMTELRPRRERERALTRVGGQNEGTLLILNEGSLMECSRPGGSLSKVDGEKGG